MKYSELSPIERFRKVMDANGYAEDFPLRVFLDELVRATPEDTLPMILDNLVAVFGAAIGALVEVDEEDDMGDLREAGRLVLLLSTQVTAATDIALIELDTVNGHNVDDELRGTEH